MDAGEDDGALAAVWAAEAVAALLVNCSVGAAVRGGEEAFVEVAFAVEKGFAVVLYAVAVRSFRSAVFPVTDGESGHYTSSKPPSVRNFFPTQMRCASFTARSTFGCRSGLR